MGRGTSNTHAQSGFAHLFGKLRGQTRGNRELQRALDRLPLQLDQYDPELRVKVTRAVREVLRTPPVAPAPLAPLYPPVADPAPLPASAPRLIGLVGKPQTGKDVVADYTEAHYQGVARLAFSDSIKWEANAWLVPYGHTIDDSNKNVPAYRRLLQEWAFARRTEDPDYWGKRVAEAVQSRWDDGARLVLATGVRAPQEFDLIQAIGGEVWKVERPGLDYQAVHAVETALDHIPNDDFDKVILNPEEGNLAPYEQNIRQALGESE